MKKDWLKDIHDRMEDFEVDEPQGLWDSICSVEEQTGIPVVGSSKKSHMPWVWGMTAAAACALFVWHFYPNPAQNQMALHPVAEPLAVVESRSSQGGDIHAEEKEEDRKGRVIRVKADETSLLASQSDSILISSPNLAEESVGETHAVSSSQPEGRKSEPQKETQPERRYIAQSTQKRKSEHRLALSLSASGGNGAMSRELFHGGYLLARAVPGDAVWADSPMLGIMDLNKGVETAKKMNHHSPVRVGLSLSYALNERWSIGSGITYALVSSEMQEGSTFNYIREEQTLHYMGIPLTLNYKALSWKNFEFYLSPDVLVEQCVDGKKDRTYIINGKTQDEERISIKARPLQLSFGAKVGLQYKANSFLSVYAEPGCRYYLDDRSSLETIFKEHKLDFDFNLGLRFTIGN